MNVDRAAELIAWTIRSRLERYGIRFLPVDTLDIEDLAAEIAATLRDPPVEFRNLIVHMAAAADDRPVRGGVMAAAIAASGNDGWAVGWVAARAGHLDPEPALAELEEAGFTHDEPWREAFRAGHAAKMAEQVESTPMTEAERDQFLRDRGLPGPGVP